ncbi:MAG: hypothetical protein AAGH81_00520 [Bacteroidota bacterium]
MRKLSIENSVWAIFVLIVLSLAKPSFGQTAVISGYILDEQQRPLPDVNIS